MLINLTINNIVLIEHLDIQLEQGFCVLTGETGAGKSILLDALGLALGRRASSNLLRSGQQQGSVTATFDTLAQPEISQLLSKQGIEHESELLLRRVIYSDGRTKSFINDTPVSLNILSQIGEQLVEIHGQHDQRGLLNPSLHRSVVDEYGQLHADLNQVHQCFMKYESIKSELQSMQQTADQSKSEEDYLKFVLQELANLAPRPGLENELAAKRSQLLNREKFIETINNTLSIIQNSNIDSALNSAHKEVIKNTDIYPNLNTISDMLDRASIEVEEAITALRQEASNLEITEESLEPIEEQLFALRDAARKANVTTDELVNYQQQITDKLNKIANHEQIIRQLQQQLVQTKQEYLEKATHLSKQRKSIATNLESLIATELTPLKMENTRLKVQIDQLPEEAWSTNGFDKISFLVSTNPGVPFLPLGKIASGGELSRFMLALKVVLSNVKSVPTLIFDEIDTGIGGAVADAVGRRLAVLATKLQVLTITHQPQVAARGTHHLKIQKHQNNNITTTNISTLSIEERQEELARMLAGEGVTDEARAAATSLLEVA